jgi:hypothetical protein
MNDPALRGRWEREPLQAQIFARCARRARHASNQKHELFKCSRRLRDQVQQNLVALLRFACRKSVVVNSQLHSGPS